MEKLYRGWRAGPNRLVTVQAQGEEEEPLLMRWDLVAVLSEEFDWGYLNAGSHALAVTLLADATANDTLAQGLAEGFQHLVTSLLPVDQWVLSVEVIRQWVWAHDKAAMDREVQWRHDLSKLIDEWEEEHGLPEGGVQ